MKKREEQHMQTKTKHLFHQKFPQLDEFLHPLETDWERRCRRLAKEDPEAYRKMMERNAEQMEKLRASARRTGSVGLSG